MNTDMKRIFLIVPGFILALPLQTAAQQTSVCNTLHSDSWFMWLVIGGGFLFYLWRLWQKHKNMVISLFQTITGKFRTRGDVTTPESKKILIGAIYANQQGAYLNTLKADIGDKMYTILSDWWDINGTDTAIEKLDYLRDKAFAYYFPTVWKAFHAASDEERKAIILETMTTQEDAEKAYSQTQNLLESVDILRKLEIIERVEDVNKYGVLGWDAGRLVFIARLCYDARYISEQQAWEYIDEACRKVWREFHSWDELAKSYLIGRFIWGGKDADDGMDSLADDLLHKPKSPWNNVPWGDTL
jgi:hypothetical protein